MSGTQPSTITASTRLCAVYGHPIRHSASPAMQNAGIAALGLDWRYVAFDVPPSELASAVAGAKAMRFVGLNLTVPHKLLALELVDVLDGTARTFRAVNTIRFESRDAAGAWVPIGRGSGASAGEVRAHGFNTDAEAVARALRDDLGVEPRGARVLLLGAGGAGRATALKLASEGVATLWLVNRTAARAADLRDEIRAGWPEVPVELGYPPGMVDCAINATSLGLDADDGLPWDPRAYALGRAGAVLDLIYRPAETRLLAAARASGCRVANGLGMLLYQGTAALELWTGRPAPVDAMRAALEREVYRV